MTDPDQPPSWTPIVFLIPAQAALTFAAGDAVWWMQNHGQAGRLLVDAGLVVAVTAFLVLRLGRIASHRGHSWTWGFLGVFSLFGVAAIVCLPPRRAAVQGFPVRMNEPDA